MSPRGQTLGCKRTLVCCSSGTLTDKQFFLILTWGRETCEEGLSSLHISNFYLLKCKQLWSIHECEHAILKKGCRLKTTLYKVFRLLRDDSKRNKGPKIQCWLKICQINNLKLIWIKVTWWPVIVVREINIDSSDPRDTCYYSHSESKRSQSGPCNCVVNYFCGQKETRS